MFKEVKEVTEDGNGPVKEFISNILSKKKKERNEVREKGEEIKRRVIYS